MQTPTNQYANLMRQAEQAVDKALRAKGKGPLPNNMKGRGQQLEVVWVQEHSAPVKKPTGRGVPTKFSWP